MLRAKYAGDGLREGLCSCCARWDEGDKYEGRFRGLGLSCLVNRRYSYICFAPVRISNCKSLLQLFLKMRFSLFVPVVCMGVAAVNAQTANAPSVTVLNVWSAKTLTALSADDKSVTYYSHHCTSRPANVSSALSSFVAASAPVSSGVKPLITPAPGVPGFKRRDVADDVSGIPGLCFDYKLQQGPSNWELHATDPVSGLLTVDIDCDFRPATIRGAATELNCTYDWYGKAFGTSTGAAYANILWASEGSTSENQLRRITAALETASGEKDMTVYKRDIAELTFLDFAIRPASTSAPSTGKASGSTSVAPGSTGMAAGLPVPTSGAAAFIGGAAGVFAAVLAL